MCVHLWKSEDNLRLSFLFPLWDQGMDFRLSGMHSKCLHTLSHPAGPQFFSFLVVLFEAQKGVYFFYSASFIYRKHLCSGVIKLSGIPFCVVWWVFPSFLSQHWAGFSSFYCAILKVSFISFLLLSLFPSILIFPVFSFFCMLEARHFSLCKGVFVWACMCVSYACVRVDSCHSHGSMLGAVPQELS